MASNKRNHFIAGVRDGIPIGLGYAAVSFSFGIMATSGGLTIWQAVLISLTCLTSAGQFAGLGILLAHGSAFELALSQVIINLRYILMSFSLSQKLLREEGFAHRFLVAFGVTDEIFGVSAGKEGKISAFYNYGLMSAAIPGWTLGTLLGGISGSLLPPFLVSALSVMLYGMFLAVIIPPAKTSRPVLAVVVTSMAISSLFAFVPILKNVSPGFSIILTTLLTAGGAAILFPIEE